MRADPQFPLSAIVVLFILSSILSRMRRRAAPRRAALGRRGWSGWSSGVGPFGGGFGGGGWVAAAASAAGLAGSAADGAAAAAAAEGGEESTMVSNRELGISEFRDYN